MQENSAVSTLYFGTCGGKSYRAWGRDPEDAPLVSVQDWPFQVYAVDSTPVKYQLDLILGTNPGWLTNCTAWQQSLETSLPDS